MNFTRFHLALIAYGVWLSSLPAIASQPGFPAPDFVFGAGPDFSVLDLTRQRDGKILVGGHFTTFQGLPRRGIARLLANGKVDQSFHPGLGAGGGVKCVLVQPDGRILISGFFSTYNGVARSFIARLGKDGTLESSFHPQPNNWVTVMLLQPDGKIVIGGSFTEVDGVARNRIARLHRDGTLDMAFDPGDGCNGMVNALARDASGRVYVGGEFTEVDGAVCNRLARLLPTGARDDDFDTSLGMDGPVNRLLLTPAGALLAGGSFLHCQGTACANLARLLPSGGLDPAFPAGAVTNDAVHGLAALSKGRVLVTGGFSMVRGQSRKRVAVLLADGSLDTTFDPGAATSELVEVALALPSGRMLVAGSFYNFNQSGRTFMAQLLPNGAVDEKFLPGGAFNLDTTTLAVQADGKLLVGGWFSSYNGVESFRLARLHPDGRLDESFQVGAGFGGGPVAVVKAQPDGKVLVGGWFTSYQGHPVPRLTRLLENGQRDPLFTPGTGPDSIVQTIEVIDGGKILIGGDFEHYNGTAIKRVARLNANGTLDPGFDPGTGFDDVVQALAATSTGAIYVGGSFSSVDGTPSPYLARLDADGGLDLDYGPGDGPDAPVRAILVEPGDGVLLGGFFDVFAGAALGKVARLDETGVLDPGFDPGGGANGAVFALARQSDGRILAGGNFSQFGGVGRVRLARLESDGQLDLTFHPGAGPDAGVWALAILPGDRLAVGGQFHTCDFQAGKGLAVLRLNQTFLAETFSGIADPISSSDAAAAGRATVTFAKSGLFTLRVEMQQEVLRYRGSWNAGGKVIFNLTRSSGELVYVEMLRTRGSRGQPVIEGWLIDPDGKTARLRLEPAGFSTRLLPANHFMGTYQIGLRMPLVTHGIMPPSGDGFLTVRIARNGRCAAAGRALDGAVLTASLPLTRDGRLLTHLVMHRKRAAITGVLVIDESQEAPAARPVSGFVVHRRPPGLGGRYTVDFVETLTVTGSQYAPRPSLLPAFGGTDPASIYFDVTGGSLNFVGENAQLSFALNGRALVLASSGLNGLRLTVNRSRGTFSGSFIPAGHTRAVSIQGVLATPSLGCGYALIPTAPGAATVLPSRVRLQVVVP